MRFDSINEGSNALDAVAGNWARQISLAMSRDAIQRNKRGFKMR
jgi:hypothetical protein